jgi:hypothetical protein
MLKSKRGAYSSATSSGKALHKVPDIPILEKATLAICGRTWYSRSGANSVS